MSGLDVSKLEVGAVLDVPAGFDVSKLEVGAVLDPPPVLLCSKLEVGAWLDPPVAASVGLIEVDDAELLEAGNTYYRRIFVPFQLKAKKVYFEVGETNASVQITGKLLADASNAPGAELATSDPQVGTTADVPDDLPLTSAEPTIGAGTYVWVAVAIATINVNGKIKKGGRGRKNTVEVPVAYSIWLEGEAVPGTAVISFTGDLTLNEGDPGDPAIFLFDVERSVHTVGSHAIDWAVTGAGGADVGEADDFSGDAFPSGTLSFADGETTKQISIPLNGDDVSEAAETFTITLSNPTNGAILGQSSALGIISNDDGGGQSGRYFGLRLALRLGL